LMLGLVTPQKGTAGIITEKNTFIPGNADIRRYFSYVPQGNTILSGTVAENMRIVKEDATDEEIISCLKTACAWEFIERMPQGINNPVGERGRGLSEGQAQRLAIARALLRDAPVLLLDEATSALDVATEREVLRNIMGDHAERTCIVTTHRPSVLTMCSRVYGVMEKEVRELSEEESARMAIDF
ncbi:MAG: ATP-binding cassette domain-containing protein, partial [Solobacterium sp.]|nr:ATP-binding cassette domain-containing protein [Solobacterium sp.]